MTDRIRAGAALLVLCGQYFVAEAVAAAASARPYSYARDYISDLGVTHCLPTGPCSPLGAVMNGSLVLSGLLAVVAALLLRPLLPCPGTRALLLALVLCHALGSATVGLVPSAPGTAAGTPHIHVLGAYAAIVGGNLAVVLAGLAAAPQRRWAPFRAASAALGALGLASGLALVVTRGWPPGLLERGAVDTITVWEILAGALLLAERWRAGARPARA